MFDYRINVLVFWIVQASALLGFVYRPSWALASLAAGSYAVRMLGITLCFHRHLAHRSFEMPRPMRFAWCFVATTAMQKGPLWWAGNHVYHHRFADREGDPHSPILRGFYYSHIGWFLHDQKWDKVDESNPVVRHFSRYPELRWLDRWFAIPPSLLALACLSFGGLPGLVWGFAVPTALLAHCTFCINSVNHLWGTRRFETSDASRNNPATALLTLGEGWHNNHHRFQRSARNGFFWWEYDVTYWTIRLMGLVWLARDIVGVPDRIYIEARATRRSGSSQVQLGRDTPSVDAGDLVTPGS